MDSMLSLKSLKRHYKKDSRYVNDLYTLTYDNHESVEDTAELISSLFFQIDVESKSNENSKPFGAANQLIRNANLHHRLVHAHNQYSPASAARMNLFIKEALKKVNKDHHFNASAGTHFTPNLLKSMNITQLQIILNQVYEFRNSLNETLMKSLLERDELLSKRDSMLACIEVNRGQ